VGLLLAAVAVELIATELRALFPGSRELRRGRPGAPNDPSFGVTGVGNKHPGHLISQAGGVVVTPERRPPKRST
jgi:hypothetical protein